MQRIAVSIPGSPFSPLLPSLPSLPGRPLSPGLPQAITVQVLTSGPLGSETDANARDIPTTKMLKSLRRYIAECLNGEQIKTIT